LLCPSSIAFVGLSDTSHFARTIRPTFDSDAEIFMVNPRYDTVLGRPNPLDAASFGAAAGPPLPRPASEPVREPEGLMLPFGATMDLLAGHGIPVAPYHLVWPRADAAQVRPPFAGPYAVKLADVAHRTEHDAVRLRVEADGLAGGEALLGIQGQSELGPLVVLGLGGIFVEVLNRVGGRMAPFTTEVARDLIEEFADLKVMHGFGAVDALLLLRAPPGSSP
jgi:ATP-grasp domain